MCQTESPRFVKNLTVISSRTIKFKLSFIAREIHSKVSEEEEESLVRDITRITATSYRWA